MHDGEFGEPPRPLPETSSSSSHTRHLPSEQHTPSAQPEYVKPQPVKPPDTTAHSSSSESDDKESTGVEIPQVRAVHLCLPPSFSTPLTPVNRTTSSLNKQTSDWTDEAAFSGQQGGRTSVSFSYPPRHSPHRVTLARESSKGGTSVKSEKYKCPSVSSPKYEEFTRAWAAYKESKPDWSVATLSLPSLPSPVGRKLVPPTRSPVRSPDWVSPKSREVQRPLIKVPTEEASMAPPVAARTMSCCIYLGATAVFLCGLAAMLTAEFSSGLVQHAMMPLRMAIKPVSCEPQPENDHEIVHIDCPIRKLQQFYPPPDFSSNLDPFRGLFFEMRVEMYQYNIIPGMFRSTLGGVWSESLLPSQEGWTWLSSAKNPDFFPHVPGSGRHFGHALYGGGFKLERPHLIDFHAKKQLDLKEDSTFVEETDKPPTRVTSQNTQLYNNYLYTGNPLRPAIGDIRVSFYGSAATHLSAVGQQAAILGGWSGTDRMLKGFVNPLSKTNETRTLVMEGDYTAKELLDAFTYENDVPSRYLALTRSLGFATAWLWMFFTYKMLTKRAAAAICATTLLSTMALCITLIGLTKLTYSIPACIACVISGAILFMLSCGLQRQPTTKEMGESKALVHDYTVIKQDEEADRGPVNASHSNSVYAAI